MRTKDKLFIKEYDNLKNNIILNWIELFTLLLVSFLVSLKFLNVIYWEHQTTPTLISGVLALFITVLFFSIKKHQLSITQFDKENIYKKISSEF